MNITLYYREGSSDKVYRAAIEPKGEGYVVNFAYGRRGATLNTGTKTNSPVAIDKAQRIYDKLVRDKMAKGYTPGAHGTAYSAPQHEGSKRVTNVRPQLLNPTEDVEPLIKDDTFYIQPKQYGKRLLVLKANDTVTGINRRGIECGVPETIRAAALGLPGDYLIDGEAVGDTLHVFDILERQGVDLRNDPYKRRLTALLNLLASGQQNHIQWVVTQLSEEKKRNLFEQMRDELAEGVVFKRITAPYTPGRPNSGGDQLKYKFVETASVMITAINAKRSVAISVWGDGNMVPAGNVTIPPDQPVPNVGEIADVRYLYAIRNSGCLYQPLYLGTRDDIAAAECTRDQLKFRKEPAMETH